MMEFIGHLADVIIVTIFVFTMGRAVKEVLDKKKQSDDTIH